MTARARIYKPARTAMQSGKGNARSWVLDYEPAMRRTTDPLMGWTSSGDMNQQLTLRFDTKEEAIAYAERNGIAYRLFDPPPERLLKKSYSENFKWGRTDNWTH
jgi:hypothetical protein